MFYILLWFYSVYDFTVDYLESDSEPAMSDLEMNDSFESVLFDKSVYELV